MFLKDEKLLKALDSQEWKLRTAGVRSVLAPPAIIIPDVEWEGRCAKHPVGQTCAITVTEGLLQTNELMLRETCSRIFGGVLAKQESRYKYRRTCAR